MRGKRVDASAPPWLRRDARALGDAVQRELELVPRRRLAAEAICKASPMGFAKPHLAYYIEQALNLEPGADYVVRTGQIEGRSGSLSSEVQEWETACRNARSLRDLTVDGVPVFITMHTEYGPAGYGYTGLLSITLRLDPRIRKRFAEGL